MEYIKKSFFEKYNIAPNIEKNKIKILFQTNPNLRKDLPAVVKIINSDERLFEEELFTFTDKTNLVDHYNLIVLMDKIMNNDFKNDFKLITQSFLNILNSECYYKNFYYSKFLSDEKAKKIYEDFLSCYADELKHQFISSIGLLSNSKLKKFYLIICEIFESVDLPDFSIELFNEDICDYLNNLLTFDNVGEEFISRLKSLLFLNKIIKDKFYTDSLLHIIKNMINDLNKYEECLLSVYKDMSDNLNKKEFVDNSEFLKVLISKYLLIRGNSSKSDIKESYSKLKAIQKCCVVYDMIVGLNKREEDYLATELLMDFIVYSGVDWYLTYNDYFTKMLEDFNAYNIYSLINMVILGKPDRKVLKYISNVIINSSTFNIELDYILNCHKEVVDGVAEKYIDPFFVDNFIAKFYFVIYTLEDKNLNKEFFDGIKNVGLGILKINDDLIRKLQTSYVDYYTKLLIKERIVEAYNMLPGNWIIDGKTIKNHVKLLDSVFTGKDGDAEEYINKYKTLFSHYNRIRKEIYCCPVCGYYVDLEDDKCCKCNSKFDWSNTKSHNNNYDNSNDNSYDNNYNSSENYNSDFDTVVLMFIILAIIVVIILIFG